MKFNKSAITVFKLTNAKKWRNTALTAIGLFFGSNSKEELC
tara:strand:+ start:162 stop:284 length:123 start_codon:yes stop_codon:yes gene_type:complete